jgi:hypothetical protein
MLSRFIIKRYCQSRAQTKCYENIHKIDSLRQDVNEIKEFMKNCEQPLITVYRTSVLSFIFILFKLFN